MFVFSGSNKNLFAGVRLITLIAIEKCKKKGCNMLEIILVHGFFH